MPSVSRLSFVAGVALAALTSMPGAARADAIDTVATYGVDRLADFVDIFRLRVGVPRHGEGYGAKVRATALLQLGYVRYNGDYWGLERRAIGWTDENREEGGISLLYGSAQEMMPVWGNSFLTGDTLWSEIENRRIIRNLPYWDDGRGHFDSIGAEIATPILAIDLGIYPSEIVDFITGFVLIDPFNDDTLFLEDDWRYDFGKPTTLPGPDLEAATARKKAELDALYAEMEAERLREAGQLDGVVPLTSDTDDDTSGGMELEPVASDDEE